MTASPLTVADAPDMRQEVVGHVLDEQALVRGVGLRIQQLADDAIAVTIHRGHDLVAARMRRPGYPQVVAIQGLIDHADARQLGKAVHERRRHVSRAGPEKNRWIHCNVFNVGRGWPAIVQPALACENPCNLDAYGTRAGREAVLVCGWSHFGACAV